MDGAFAGNLRQLRVLFGGQRAGEFEFNIDSVHHAILGFAFLAISCVNTRVPERNCDVLERELFPARVKTNGHGSANAKTCQQIIVRIGPGIAAACAHRFVSDKAMLTPNDFLLKAVGAAAHDDFRRFIIVLFSHNRDQARRIPANASR